MGHQFYRRKIQGTKSNSTDLLAHTIYCHYNIQCWLNIVEKRHYVRTYLLKSQYILKNNKNIRYNIKSIPLYETNRILNNALFTILTLVLKPHILITDKRDINTKTKQQEKKEN